MTKSTTKYSNNARTTLSADITSGSTTLQVVSSLGFPSINTATDHFLVTLDDGNGNVEVVKVRGISGNSFINCLRAQEGTTAQAFTSTTKVENRLTAGNITNFARLTDRLASVNSIEDLDPPSDMDGNSALCASADATGAPIIAVVSGTKWRLINYPDIVKIGVTGFGTGPNTLTVQGVHTQLIDTRPKTYVIQFTSGVCMGLVRFISSINTNSISWVTALPNVPGSSDSFEIYRCISSWKNATGGNSDRIFFENDAQVWSDYTLPAGRNATSAGPVIINSGVTITIPSGSSWSIV